MRIITVASHGIIGLMTMIALMGSAFAEAGLNRADVQAKKACQTEESRACPTPGTDKSLERQRKRYVELVLESTAEFTNELAVVRKAETTGTLKQRLMRFSCALDCQKAVAVKYIPLFESVRADTAAMVVPKELLATKEALLSAMDDQIGRLVKIKEIEMEEFIDAALNLGNQGRKDDSADPDCFPIAVSILPNLELPDREKGVCGIRINLVGGSHVDVAGLDFGGVFNSVSRKARGIQFAGVCNIGSNVVEGIQFAGLGNGCKSLVGLQGAPLFNVAGVVDGVQMSGLINFNFKLRGCQISCCGNYAIIGAGCQFGWSNIAEKMNGAQFGGCMSAANDLEGLQLAAFNWGGCCRGVQIGVINQCEKMEGLQVGVINYADAASGCQVGVFNVIATSSIPFLPLVNMNF